MNEASTEHGERARETTDNIFPCEKREGSNQ